MAENIQQPQCNERQSVPNILKAAPAASQNGFQRMTLMVRTSRIALGATAAIFSLGLVFAPAAFAQDKMSKDGMKKEDTMSKDGMKKDAMGHDGMKKDGMMKKDDGMKKNEMKK